MAIKANKSDKSSAGGGTKYTGLLMMRPMVLNPSKATLEKMGITLEKEPEYISSETDANGKVVNKVRLTWYLREKIGEGDAAHVVTVNHSVFLESRYNYNKDRTKIQVIDKFGKSTYIPTADWKAKNITHDWLDKASLKPALVGEEELISFMRTFAKVKKEDETQLKDFCVGGDFKSLFKADGSGLAELKKDTRDLVAMENWVKVLLGVKFTEDGKSFQVIFNKFIGYPFSKAKYFHKELYSLNKNSSTALENFYYGPIDLSREEASEEEYRLRVYEESEDDGGTAKVTDSAGPRMPTDSDDEFGGDMVLPSGDDEDFSIF